MILAFLVGSLSMAVIGGLLLVWIGEEQYKARHTSFIRWLIGRK